MYDSHYYDYMARHVWGDEVGDPTESVAVNVCENCRTTCDRLYRLDEELGAASLLVCERCKEEGEARERLMEDNVDESAARRKEAA